MRRFRDPETTSPVTPGWIDSLPAGGQVHIAANVPTAAQLLAAVAQGPSPSHSHKAA